MKLVRFGGPGEERPGVVDQQGQVRDVSARVSDWTGEALNPDWLAKFSVIDAMSFPAAPAYVRLGPPVPAPGKIVCIGLNYADHAAETGFELPTEPLVFFKSPSAICGPTDPIKIPRTADAVDWEVELACVIGRPTVDVGEEEAMEAVAGFTVANDVTERNWQFKRGGQWSKAKSADTFAPLGPWLVTRDDVTDLGARRIWLRKNDVLRQDSILSRMIFTVPQIVAHLSEFMHLMPGDVILTGTPHGVAYNKSDPDYLRPGDLLRCGIEGLGEQLTKVAHAEESEAVADQIDVECGVRGESNWKGRFPRNEIISLLDVNRRYNLAESTAQDLTFEEILDLAGGPAAVGKLKMGYGSSAGLPQLRAGIAAFAGVQYEEVITTQGTALGLFMLAFELCRAGDEAVIVTPCFPPARDTLVGVGAALRECRLSFDQGFNLTAGALEPLLNERTKLVSIASPQNPSGVATSLAEIKAILDLMRRKAPEAYLFVDETYRDATYGDGVVPQSAATLNEAIITGGSVSKAHGAPGLRVGWLTIREPKLRERLTTAKMNLVISGSPLDETLAAAILANREKILSPRRSLLMNGLSQVADWVDRQKSLIEWVKPDGGALCCLRLNPNVFRMAQVERFWSALPEAELQIGDGAWFGESSAVLRLGFGYLAIEVLPAALAALSEAVEAAARP